MSARNRHGTCGYCGKERKLTRDHVPPKLFLEQPYPENLRIVPACYPCNQSFKEDDEYTRTVIALDVRAGQNEAAQCKLPAIIRSLQSPNAIGFAKYLATQTTVSSILGIDGRPMGQMIDVDRARVLATGRRLVRGLYFLEFGKPLSEKAVINVGAKAGPMLADSDMATIGRGFVTFPEHRDGAAGKAFSYAVAMGPDVSFWVLLLYDYFFWAATVDERGVTGRDLVVPVKS